MFSTSGKLALHTRGSNSLPDVVTVNSDLVTPLMEYPETLNFSSQDFSEYFLKFSFLPILVKSHHLISDVTGNSCKRHQIEEHNLLC